MTAPAAGSLGLDQRALAGLRDEAARDPRQAARAAAVQFEGLFMQMVLKSMRDASPKAEGAGAGEDSFTAMLDTQFARQFAGRPNGLADMIEKQLARQLGQLPAPTLPAATAPSGAAQPTPAPAAPAAPASGSAAFIRRMLPHAREAERQTGVPASFILGQAALESGWGRAELKNPDGSNSFNLFGIKATRGWKGASTEVATTEYVDGQAVRQQAAFRSYGSYAEAFADYARLLARHPRYGEVLRNAGSAEAFAGGMQRAGYATDPAYADKLARTIRHTAAVQRAVEGGAA